MHDLLEEYVEKSLLPTPLSLFETIYLNCSLLWSRIRSAVSSTSDNEVAVHQLSAHDARRLESFQEKHTERYLDAESKNRQNRSQALDKMNDLSDTAQANMLELHIQIQRLESRIDQTVAANIKTLKDQLFELIPTLPNRNKTFDEALRKVRHRPLRLVSLPKTHATRYVSAPDRQVIWHHPALPNHVRAGIYQDSFRINGVDVVYFLKNPNLPRAHLYDNANLLVLYTVEEQFLLSGQHDKLIAPRSPDGAIVNKIEVPAHAVLWDVELPDYAPPDYTAPYTLFFGPDSPVDCPKWADAANTPQNAAEASPATIETLGYGFDKDRRPLNPRGRTGIRGRGCLGMWGPNRTVNYVITRSKFDDNEAHMERAGKVMQEVLLCKRKDGRWVLPGRFQDDDSIDPLLRNAFGLEAKSLKQSEVLQEVEHKLMDAHDVKTLFDSVVQDDRDTDNAWVVFNFKFVEVPRVRASASNMDGGFEIAEDPDSGFKFEWVTLHKNLELTYASHYSLVEGLATYKKAYW